jgi:hypothetical protein
MIESKPMTNPEIPAANSPLLEAMICPEKVAKTSNCIYVNVSTFINIIV